MNEPMTDAERIKELMQTGKDLMGNLLEQQRYYNAKFADLGKLVDEHIANRINPQLSEIRKQLKYLQEVKLYRERTAKDPIASPHFSESLALSLTRREWSQLVHWLVQDAVDNDDGGEALRPNAVEKAIAKIRAAEAAG